MTYSEFETELLAAAEVLWRGHLGEELRRFHPGRRSAYRDQSQFLSGMELNHPPAVQRTVRILYTARMAGFDLGLTAADRPYLAWVSSALSLLQSVADGWWGPINPDIRRLFLDGDDMPPITLLNPMFPGLRAPRPLPIRRTARPLGLLDTDLAAFSRVRRASQRTPVFRAAAEIALEIRSDSSRRRALLAERDRRQSDIAIQEGSSVHAEAERLRRLTASLYEDSIPWVRRATTVLRAFNELVHTGLAFLLGYAEEANAHDALTPEAELPITVDASARQFDLHLTLTNAKSLATGATFRIEDGGPLDGLYIQTGAGIQATGNHVIVDRRGSRIRELELAPPERSVSSP